MDNTAYTPIASTGGRYEVNRDGKVRNAKTGKAVQSYVALLCEDGRRFVSIESLLWEVFGIKKSRRLQVIEVEAEFKQIFYFHKAVDCAKWLSTRLNRSVVSMQTCLSQRQEKIGKYKIKYKYW